MLSDTILFFSVAKFGQLWQLRLFLLLKQGIGTCALRTLRREHLRLKRAYLNFRGDSRTIYHYHVTVIFKSVARVHGGYVRYGVWCHMKQATPAPIFPKRDHGIGCGANIIRL